MTKPLPDLHLNGARFLPRSNPGPLPPDANGLYSITPGGHITLFDLERRRVGGINRHGVLHSSTRLESGDWWHSYAHPAVVPPYQSYAQQCEECRAALRLVSERVSSP